MRHNIFKLFTGVILLFMTARAGWAQIESDLRTLSLEDLLNIEVTTASRVPTTRAMVPAAVHVITQEEIRRTGAKSIPELLRFVPGIQVARVDSNKWAIGIRGFTDRLARAMLVMIDGRAVYSPLFAGTYWELQDTLLEDVDRIEVIRGPGGTLWGSNAVNGIINIITKNAQNTQGSMLKFGGGPEEQGFGSFRYGGRHGQNLYYRGYGKFFNRDAAFHASGNNYDAWRMERAGFRTDWTSGANRSLTIQGDLYGGVAGQLSNLTTYTPPFTQVVRNDSDLGGGNILGRWEGPAGRRSDLKLQLYYDRTSRKELTFREERDTFDVDLQHNFSPSEKQQFAWGAAYRVSSGRTESVATLRFLPPGRTDNLFTWFAQDEIKLVPDRLHLTLGSKFEHNNYSGFEVQPSARLVWAFSPEHTAVFSVARAFRTPSRVEHDLEISSQLAAPQLAVPAFLRLTMNKEFQPERLTAYEAGYRVRPISRLFLTLSTFLNQHHDLLSTEVATAFMENTPAPPHVVLPLLWSNNLHGNSHGLELTSDLRLAEWWRWTASYSLLRIQLTRDANGTDLSQERAGEGNSPEHQFSFQSSIDLPANVEFDWMFRYVSELPNLRIPKYATSDVRLGWRPYQAVELSVVGKNLHDPQHPEFSTGSELRRSFWGEVTFRW